MNLALELTQSGAQHLQNGDVHQALKDLVVAHDRMTKAVREDPSVEKRGFFGITCLNLALVYQMMQDFESFREYVRAGIGVLEELLPERETMETLLYLASMNLQLGQVEETEGNLEEAETAYRKAIDYQSRVAARAEDPDAKEYALQTLSQEHLILTGLYQKMEDEERYLAELERTVDAKLDLAEQFDTPYNRADAAMGQATLAGVLAQKAPVRAEELFRTSVATLEQQTEVEADIGDVLVQVWRDFSVFLQQQGREEEALTFFGKAEDLAKARQGSLDAEVGSVIENAALAGDLSLQDADRTREQLFPDDE